jgi:hypothetical protein
MAKSPLNRKPKRDTPPPPMELRPWLIALGIIPALGLAMGVGMIGYQNFWLGCALVTSATLYLLFELLKPNSQFRLRQKVIGSSVLATIYGVFLWLIFVSAPLTVFISSEDGNYADGADIFGMKWHSNYSKLHMILTNESDFDYTNVDIRVHTTRNIVDAGWSTEFNACIVKADLKNFAGEVIMTDKNGNRADVPLDVSRNRTLAPVYRIHCNSFLAKSTIEIIFAVPAPKEFLSWAIVSVAYDGGYRHRTQFVPKCFITQCGNIPDHTPVSPYFG